MFFCFLLLLLSGARQVRIRTKKVVIHSLIHEFTLMNSVHQARFHVKLLFLQPLNFYVMCIYFNVVEGNHTVETVCRKVSSFVKYKITSTVIV